MPSERTPLLNSHGRDSWVFTDQSEDDYHSQFCKLIGIPPSDLDHDTPKRPEIPKKFLYGRALSQKKNQQRTYALTASVSNILLLSQVVLGAAVTALGASESSHILITIFGAMNTIIAGVVAYLKSRGQPMRARMYRDDLERVVDEIENSEIMWRGISRHMHGYDEIDTNQQVTVRSEVARLTRLYNKAVRNNTSNNPDIYQIGLENQEVKLRHSAEPSITPSAPASGPAVAPPVTTDQGGSATTATIPPTVPDPDASPATALLPQCAEHDEMSNKVDEVGEDDKIKAADNSQIVAQTPDDHVESSDYISDTKAQDPDAIADGEEVTSGKGKQRKQ